VWEATVAPADAAALQQRLLTTRAVRTAQGVRLRILAVNRPLPDAVPAAPDLEDAYVGAVHA
jgi:hypothetical protein